MSNRQQFLSSDLVSQDEYLVALESALREAGADVAETLSIQTISVSARPTGYWNNTGIYKPKGLVLIISYAGGSWKSNKYWGPTDGAGDSRYAAGASYLCPGVAEGALIAKVGGNHAGGGSAAFPIGNYGFVGPDLEGLVWLTVNDEPRGFGDNTGSINVAVNIAST